jgi:MerR family transcriptional regulator/heat shock protein HspR
MFESGGESTKPSLNIGEVAKLTGISTHSIRLYEKEGLLNPRRTPSGRRIYASIDLDLVKTTRRLLSRDLNFAGIRRLYAVVPCHAFKPCCIPRLGHCSVQDKQEQPCWSLADTWCRKTNQICQECKVYRMATEIDNIRESWSNTYFRERPKQPTQSVAA